MAEEIQLGCLGGGMGSLNPMGLRESGWEEGMWLEVKGTDLGGVFVKLPNSENRTYIRNYEILNRRTK